MVVLDLDFDSLPEKLTGFAGSEGALLLLRIAGRPVGQVVLPLENGCCCNLRREILRSADTGFWEAQLRLMLELPPEVPAPVAMPRSTVAVCTRDRTDDLERCIAALLAMPDDGQEILVVDNAPRTDATRSLVALYPKVRYVREDRPGLDVARNRALREASGDFIAFTDDDAAPDSLWLRMLLRNFSDPLVVAATGATMPLELETEAQIRFQQYGGFLRGFKRMIFDAATHDPMLAWHSGAGVNMAFRRSVIDCVGLFDEALDAGTATCAGGDSDMMRRVLLSGYRIAYDPEALNWHRHRRSDAELMQQLYGYEVASSAVLWKAIYREKNLAAVRHFAAFLATEAKNVLRRVLRMPGAPPLALSAARLRGWALGPRAYMKAERK